AGSLNNYQYLGVDETSLGIGKNSIIVVAASTYDSSLTKDVGWDKLQKSKDILVSSKAYNRRSNKLTYENFPRFMSFEEMQEKGLDNFYWTRAKGGRFPLQFIEHLSIAHVVHTNGFDPKKTVLFVDAFHGNYDESRYLIWESLRSDGFNIPRQQINIVPDGDRSVPIINYADLLAFQIGLSMNERYRYYQPDRIRMDVELHEIEYDSQRTLRPLTTESRDRLEDIINKRRHG
ncbi:MAG: hypothetical protein ACOCZQ_03465, partial [Nanoarchaeota archaeon]